MRQFFKYIVIMSVLGFSGSVFAQENSNNLTLKQALELAAQNNATLAEARAVYFGTAENLAQALSGYRPTISANGSLTNIDSSSEGNAFITQDGGNFSESANIEAQQPIFRGGQTIAETKQSKNIINAQYWLLKNAYQDVFVDVSEAYWDIYIQGRIFELNTANRDLLQKQLEETEARFEAGELTRTDIAQSKARLAEGQAVIASARSALRQAQSRLGELTRTNINTIDVKPELLVNMPESIDIALDKAMQQNPQAISTRFLHNAAIDDVNGVLGELLPQINLIAQAERAYNPPPGFLDRQTTETLQLNATIPLYQGGATRSRARQAKYAVAENKANIVETEEALRSDVISLWEDYQALSFELEARDEQIAAAKVALEGTTEETRYGLRTFVDRLNAQQELLNAEIDFVRAERNQAIAQINLAAVTGEFLPEDIGIETTGLPNNKGVMDTIGGNWLGLDVDYPE